MSIRKGFLKVIKTTAIVLLVCAVAISPFFIYIFANQPGEEDYRHTIEYYFDITFTDEWSFLYVCSSPTGFVDGTDEICYVFNAPTEDDSIPFESEKNENIEKTLEIYSERCYKKLSGKTYTPKYKYDSEKPYKWYRKDIEGIWGEHLYPKFIIIILQDDLAYFHMDFFAVESVYGEYGLPYEPTT